MSELEKELLEALKCVSWRSACRDNMEFEARITYVQMDKIRDAISKATNPQHKAKA